MRSRPARLTLSALAWIALGTAAFLAFESHREIGARRAALRAFETTARDATDALDAAHAGQRAYVALNQNPADWFPKVATYLQTASASIDALRVSARSTAARPALLDASAAVTELGNLDTRVRESLGSEDPSPALDLVFADASDAVSKAVSNIDAAQSAEQLAADTFDLEQERRAIYALGAAGVLSALALALLGFVGPRGEAETAVESDGGGSTDDWSSSHGRLSLALDDRGASRTERPAGQLQWAQPKVVRAEDRSLQALVSAADVCTAFARVREVDEIRALLEQSAGSMNARGLIVWLSASRGSVLRPVLAHGYSEQTLQKIPPIPREADNAAAAAYRLGTMQTVRSRPGGAQGDLVAPLLVADGCIGALTAELREEGEQSEIVQALASIVAAQLAGVLQSAAAAEDSAEPAAKEEPPADQKAASGT